MEDRWKGKSIPWSDIQEYLRLHKDLIKPFEDLNQKNLMRPEFIEESLPPQILKMYDCLKNILKKSRVLEEDQRKSDEEI